MTQLCKCCHMPLTVYTQEAFIPGRPARLQAECRTNGCDLFFVTRHPDALRDMTRDEIAVYAAANAQLTARFALAETAGVG